MSRCPAASLAHFFADICSPKLCLLSWGKDNTLAFAATFESETTGKNRHVQVYPNQVAIKSYPTTHVTIQPTILKFSRLDTKINQNDPKKKKHIVEGNGNEGGNK